jgi:hypothetical protein
MFLNKLFAAQSRLSKLEEEVSSLKRQMKEQVLDYEALYDKVRHLMGRIAKRVEFRDNREAYGTEGPVETAQTSSLLTPTFSRLTPRQRQLQMQIIQKRQNSGNGG